MKQVFQNKIVWITGASSGIGEALAKAFYQQGAHLIISARRQAKLQTLANELAGSGGQCMVVPLDITDSKQVQQAVEQVYEQWGYVDILINNSGISQRALTAETSEEVDRKIMEINFFGAVRLTKLVLPRMLERKQGKIAVTSSIVGKFGFPLRSAYSASKHALHGFFDSLRAEYPELDVHIIIPGRINTEISMHALNKEGKAHGQLDKGQADGLDAQLAARKIVRAMASNKKEILVGGKEIIMVHIRRFLPRLYYKMAQKVSPT